LGSAHQRAGRIVHALWPWAHWAFPLAGAATVFACHHALLGPIIDHGGDSAHHLLSQYVLDDAVRNGDNPLGPVGLEFGMPLLRFYQCLFYLAAMVMDLGAGIDVRLAHNLLVATCFSLSPLATCFCLRRLGARRFAAGIGSLAALASVGAFANSFEAYHGIGIATQSMGALFLPLFLGVFAGMLRGRRGLGLAALLFALAFLSHAAFAIYSAAAGVLYVLVVPSSLGGNARRLMGFAALGTALVAFWLFPFVSHTAQLRPVPDSVFRGDAQRWWFMSASEDEMIGLAVSGRLLDDPRVPHDDQTDRLDRLADKLNISPTGRTRPPVMTVLAAVGLLAALLAFRRPVNRFMVAGLAFSLLLFAGPDDFRWMSAVPLVPHLQTFRCTYLIEFFAYGLVGIGLEAAIRHAWGALARRGARAAFLSSVAVVLAVVAGSILCLREIALLGARHTRPHDQEIVDEVLDAVGSLPEAGYPFRVHSLERWDVYKNWMASGGFRTICTHWKGVGPGAGMTLCQALRNRPKRKDLYGLAGVRYFSGRGGKIEAFAEAADEEGEPLYRRVPNGPDRRGRDNSNHRLLDSGREALLVPVPARPVAVACNHAQWLRLVESWLHERGDAPLAGDAPFPVRVDPAVEDAVAAMDAAEVLILLEGEGGPAISIPPAGARRVAIDPGRPLWKQVERALGRREKGGGPDRVEVKAVPWTTRSNQRFAFDVAAPRGSLLVLPTEAVPGWTARIDGEAAPVFPAGPDLVGVFVGAGSHRLELEWGMPGWHSATLWVSLAALLAALLAVALGRVRRVLRPPIRRPYAMTRPLLARSAGVVARYGVFAALAGALAWSGIKVATIGTDPVPQCPPDGMEMETDDALLEWSRGTRGGEIRLQVSARGAGGADERIVDEVVRDDSRRLKRLRPGTTYTWRLVQGGEPSPEAEFSVSRNALRYR